MTTKKHGIPEGWVKVTWEDSQRKRWVDLMPIPTYGLFTLRLIEKGGRILKEDYGY